MLRRPAALLLAAILLVAACGGGTAGTSATPAAATPDTATPAAATPATAVPATPEGGRDYPADTPAAPAASPASTPAPRATPAASPARTLAPTSPAASPTSTAASGDEAEVAIEGFAFSPASLTVAAGTIVKWKNSDSAPHTVKSTDGGFASSGTLQKGDSYSITFGTAGTFPYVCGIHSSMTGTVTVTP